jgi:hypothetical protein
MTFNRAAESITGMSALDAVGRDVLEVLQLPDTLHQLLFIPRDRAARCSGANTATRATMAATSKSAS